MTIPPLDYASANSHRLRRWRFWLLAGIAGILPLLAAFSLCDVTFRHDEMWIDPVTGSMGGKTTWVFGITSGMHITNVSPLEVRLNRSGIKWTRSWQFMSDSGATILGRMRSCAIGSTPPIFQLHMALKDFADDSTDAQLREFVRVMQSGTKEEQEATVDAAFQKVIETSSSTRTATAHQVKSKIIVK